MHKKKGGPKKFRIIKRSAHKMRAFIAIELSPDLRKRLASLEEQLKSSGGDVKWVKPENIHLTLKFLGEIDEKQLGEAAKIIQNTADKNKRFFIRLASPDAFPNINSPRIIWIRVDKGDSETKQIAKILEEKTAKVGILHESRPFSTHITLGRVRSGLNREKLVKNLENLASKPLEDSAEFLVTKITLFKSTLTLGGPIYETLKEAHLQNN